MSRHRVRVCIRIFMAQCGTLVERRRRAANVHFADCQRTLRSAYVLHCIASVVRCCCVIDRVLSVFRRVAISHARQRTAERDTRHCQCQLTRTDRK